MIASYIESFLLSSGAEQLTEWFLITIGIVFFLCLFLRLINRMHGLTAYAPTLLTTIGILGTFAGIISGLLGFEVENIDESIATLLDGLKTAFITSLAGMVTSIAYKVFAASGLLSVMHREKINEESVGAAEILSALNMQKEALDDLANAVGGDRESSLVGQIKLMRSDTADSQKLLRGELEASNVALSDIRETTAKQAQQFTAFEERLWLKLQDFADMMSKSATEQVINALKEVIADFNNNLTEQFGENFKKLNEAVLELVTWQENYKVQLEQMMAQYQHGVDSISSTEQAVKSISTESQVIPKSMNELKDVMEVNQHQLQELERHLDAFKDIRDQAVAALPSIKETIDTSVEGMRSATAIINEGMTTTSETLTKGLQDATQSVTTGLNDSISASIKSVEETTELLKSGVKDAADTLVAGVKDSSDVMVKGMDESSTELKRAITDGASEFVQNSHSVNESLQTASNHLNKTTDETKQMFEDMLSDINNDIRNLVDDLKKGNSAVSEAYTQAAGDITKELNDVTQRLANGLNDLSTQMSSDMHDLAEKHATESKRVLQGVSQSADQALQDTSEAVTKQVQALDDATARQVTTVMNNMGQALAKITGQFSTDYQRLVEAMHQTIRTNGDRR